MIHCEIWTQQSDGIRKCGDEAYAIRNNWAVCVHHYNEYTRYLSASMPDILLG